MFQDHVVDENCEIFRLGRVLGRQEAILVAKKRNNYKNTHTFSTKKSEQWDEIGRMLVSGALDRTKKIRKTAADIFAKSGLGKP